MAGWSDWYSGSMAPPLALPGGGYAPAPAVQTPMSVEELYRGIYDSSAPSLSSVSRPTVPVNPMTGMPYNTTANASVAGAGGIGAGGGGQVRYSPPVYQPNGTTVANKDQSRLPVIPAGMPLATPLASGKVGLGAMARGRGSLSLPPRPQSVPTSDVITLAFDPMSDTSGQNMANSSGKPVRGPGPNSKTYYPTNGATDKVRAPMRPVGDPPAVPGAQRQGGGLLSLFGGNGGGLLAGLFGGNSAPRTQAVAQPTSGPAIYTPSGNVHPGSFYDNSGNDMAFMPQSYQDNPRNSNGGY